MGVCSPYGCFGKLLLCALTIFTRLWRTWEKSNLRDCQGGFFKSSPFKKRMCQPLGQPSPAFWPGPVPGATDLQVRAPAPAHALGPRITKEGFSGLSGRKGKAKGFDHS